MIITAIITILQALGLAALLSVERVIGLPWVFVLLSLIWLNKNWSQKVLIIVLSLYSSLLLAIAYDFSWFASFFLLFIVLILIQFGSQIIQSQRRRFVIGLIMINLALVWITGVKLTVLSLVQLIVSYLLIVLWMKVLKIDQKKDDYSANIQLVDEK